MKQSEYSNPFQNIKKLLLLYKISSKYVYQNQNDKFFAKRQVVSIPQKGAYMQEYMNAFWIYLKQCYFKQLQKQNLSILLNLIANEKYRNDQDWEEEQRFQSEMQKIFSDTYLQEPITNKIASLNRRNWLEYAYMIWKSNFEYKDQKVKLIEIYSKIKRIRSSFESVYFKLRRQQKILESLGQSKQENLIQVGDASQIQQQIYSLQARRKKIAVQNQSILQKLRNNLNLQMNQSQLTRDKISQRDIQVYKIVFNIDQQLKYLKSQISLLQKKQIAQSFSRVIRTQEKNGKLFYFVSFQQALNLKCYKYDQASFEIYNSFRDNSLQNSYLIGRKNRYNSVSQNPHNFDKIFTKLIQQKTHQNYQEHKNEYKFVSDEVQNMQICHQCKIFYKKQILNKCGYNSFQYDKPRPKCAAFDHYIAQILKSISPFIYTLLKNIKKDLRLSFTLTTIFGISLKNLYSCNRYYCNMCMKAYKFDKKVQLCPYCVGVCNCSRCVRNETIVKLKTLFLRLSSNIKDLQDQRDYNHFIQANDLNQTKIIITDSSENNQNKQTMSNSQSPSNHYIFMKSCEQQISYLQRLIYLTLKRQKLKKKLIKSRKSIFRSQYNKLINFSSNKITEQGLIK